VYRYPRCFGLIGLVSRIVPDVPSLVLMEGLLSPEVKGELLQTSCA